MSKAIRLFIITMIFLCINSFVNAQNASISLSLLETGTIDFTAFAVGNNLTNQPRIMSVSIFPEGIDVKVGIVVEWKKNDSPNFVTLGSFTTNVFKARTFTNQDIGNSEIKIPSGSDNYNSDLLEENIKIGKPSGIYRISVTLYDPDGNFLSSAPPGLLYYLNPTEPTILLPNEGNSYDVGTLLVSWTPSAGAASYRIKANYLGSNQGREEALDASNPLVNDKDVGNVQQVNFRDIIDRELLSDTSVVLIVKAIVPGTGGDQILPSPIVMFKTNPTGASETKTVVQVQTDPKVIQLADFLQGKVNQQFVNDLKTGVITADQIQITDNDSPITIDALLELFNMFSANSESLISVQYTAQ